MTNLYFDVKFGKISKVNNMLNGEKDLNKQMDSSCYSSQVNSAMRLLGREKHSADFSTYSPVFPALGQNLPNEILKLREINLSFDPVFNCAGEVL